MPLLRLASHHKHIKYLLRIGLGLGEKVGREEEHKGLDMTGMMFKFEQNARMSMKCPK